MTPRGGFSGAIDRRFDSLAHALTIRSRREAESRKARRAEPTPLANDQGRRLGEAKVADKKTTLTFAAKDAAGFEVWLVLNIDRIHREWMSTIGGEMGD